MRKRSPLLARFAGALGLPGHSVCRDTRFAGTLGLPGQNFRSVYMKLAASVTWDHATMLSR